MALETSSKCLQPQLFGVDQLDQIRDHLQREGLVAVRDVLTAAQCERTLEDMHTLWSEHCPTHRRDDVSSFAAWPPVGLTRYALLQSEPVFRAQALRNRQSPALLAIGRALLNCEQVLCSHDRYGLMRPAVDHPAWSTHPNLHLDLDPWLYFAAGAESERVVRERLNSLNYDTATVDGRRCFLRENNLAHAALQPLFLQGSFCLADNRAEDGGFQCVPRSHLALQQWTRTHRREDYCESDPQDGFSFPREDAMWQAARRVAPLPRGTLLLWDQRVAHGSLPNHSERERAAQFVRLFSADLLSESTRRRRRSALASLLPDDFELSCVGRALFDLPD